MYEILKGRTQGITNDLVKFTQELINTPSESLKEKNVAKQVERKMKALNYDTVINDSCGNVLGIIIGRKHHPTVLLASHMDTVSASSSPDWVYNPFDATILNNRIYGLGASDCKGGLAAQIFAGSILKNSLLPLDGNLIVAACVAEENGISLGIQSLINSTLKSLELIPDYVILGEPTNLGLYYGHDGWVDFDILVRSDNSFDVQDTTTDILRNFNRSEKNQQALNHRKNLQINTPNFSEEKGIRKSVIPISHRIQSQETAEQIAAEIKNSVTILAAQNRNVSVDITIHEETQKLYNGTTTIVKKITNSWSIDPFCTLLERSRQSLEAANCTVRPGKWNLDRLGMGTAGSVLVNQFKIPTIGYGPGDEKIAHQGNEYVQIANLAETVYGTASIVHGLIGIPVFGWTSQDI